MTSILLEAVEAILIYLGVFVMIGLAVFVIGRTRK